KLIFSSDWNNASDRELRVAGRHSRKYYKHADSWLVNAVDAHRLADTDPHGSAVKADAAEQARLSLLACAHEVDV
ncbi:MAG: hypothetical protein QOJ08_1594, partial [Ilumatobacteraceae bacterium]